MESNSFVQAIKDVAITLAALTGSCVSVVGLKTWREQLKGQLETDVAQSLLREVLRWKYAIRSLRSPAMWSHEMAPGEDEPTPTPTPGGYHREGVIRAWERRWERVAEARASLNDQLAEAEVLWGEEVVEKFEQPLDRQLDLMFALQDHIRDIRFDRKPSPGRSLDEMRKDQRTLRYSKDAEHDPFGAGLEQELREAENWLRARMVTNPKHRWTRFFSRRHNSDS